MSDQLRNVFDNEVIRASAGTGKTFELSNRFLCLLASDVDCETILATTFTRKGAGEILDRIVQRLSKAALSEQETALLSAQLKLPLDQPRVQGLLRELLRNLHRLQIGTLDAFFYRISQSFRLEMGLPTQWQIANQRQIEVLHNQIINEILHDGKVVSVLHMMTKGDAQRRIANLIRSTVDQLYDICRQSDRQAWDRLQLPSGFSFGRDFNPLFEELLSLSYPHRSQLKRIKTDIALAQNEDWLNLATSTIFANILDGNFEYYSKPLPDRCVEIYQQLIQHCRGIVIDMLMRKNISTFELLHQFGARLETEKTETGQLRFDDINGRLESFISGKQTDEFAFRLDHNIDHLLLDEFQDTSISQWRVIEPFAVQTTQGGARKSFFCVGDLKQAIFSWRGGVAEIFDTVEAKLSNMSLGRSLTKSYRSSPVVIESVNQVFENLNRFQSDRSVANDAIQSWSQRFQRHETALENLSGYFSLEYAGDSDKKGLAKHPDRNRHALNKTVERIQQLHREAPEHSIGVLVRTNEQIGQLIYRLSEIGLSASEEGGNPLTDAAAIETILSLITLADHPGDSIARFHVSHSPLAAVLNLQPETPANQQANIAAANVSSSELRSEISRMGYGFSIEKYARILAPTCTTRELTRLQQLVQEAFNYEKANDAAAVVLRPDRFVDHIRNEFKASDESSAQIRVMTIHQSKGLEFDIVVLPMLYERNGWFSHNSTVVVGREKPTSPINLVCRLANQSHRNLLPKEFQEAFDQNKKREVMDSLCVLYVAMTRAVRATHVVMSHSCKPDQDSNAAVLLASLNIAERSEGTVFELGDRFWHQQTKAKTNLKPALGATQNTNLKHSFYLPSDATISKVELAKALPNGRSMAKVSPAGFGRDQKIEMSTVFGTVANTQVMNRGSFIHACFELIDWIDEGVPNKKRFKEHLKRWGAIVGKESDRLLKQFFGMLEQPELATLLNKENCLSSYRHDAGSGDLQIQVKTESRFATIVNEQLISGILDRLVLICRGTEVIAAEIIDFKTDSISHDALSGKVAQYTPQLQAYRNAVSEIYHLAPEKVAAKLAFVGAGVVIDVGGSEMSTPDKKVNDVPPPARKNGPKRHRPHRREDAKDQQMFLWEE